MNSMTSQDRYPSNSNGKYVANLDNQFSIFDQASVSMEPVVTSISESEANNLQAFISNVKVSSAIAVADSDYLTLLT